MKELVIFKNPAFGSVRTIEESGKVLFCGSDVARALGYDQPHKAIDRHCKNDGGTFHTVIDNLGREQSAKFINEGNLYRLIVHSKLPTAEKFERWVFDEVLPTIRKHGMYAKDELLDNPDLLLDIVTKLTQERAISKQLAVKNNQLQIELDSSKDWYSIKRVAALNGISWKKLDWRKLKQAGNPLGLEVRKIFDANYGEVNVYHKSAWEAAYPQCEL